jgi:Tfp pilus assembly protein PilF
MRTAIVRMQTSGCESSETCRNHGRRLRCVCGVRDRLASLAIACLVAMGIAAAGARAHPWSALPASSAPSGREEAAELQQGVRALYGGDYERARTLAAREVKAHPQSTAARILLARTEIALGNYDLAYDELRKVLHIAPKDLDAFYYLGRLSAMLAQLEYQRLLATAPDSARAHQLLAELYRDRDNISGALAEYQAALKADSKSVEVLTALGDLERSQYHFDQAALHYSQAAQIAPHDYAAAYGLGACYLYLQKPERAIVYFREALFSDPGSAAARLALGDALLRIRRPAEAVNELRAATNLEPDMRQAYTLLARAYQKLGQSERAEAALKKATALTQREIESRESRLRSDELISVPPADAGHAGPDR